MRTDCTIRTDGTLRLPNIPLICPGKFAYASRGDWIRWSADGEDGQGRVIGFVTAPEFDGELVCVAMFLNGATWERWISPEDVYDCVDITLWTDKCAWLFGPRFLETPPDKARNAYNLLASEL